MHEAEKPTELSGEQLDQASGGKGLEIDPKIIGVVTSTGDGTLVTGGIGGAIGTSTSPGGPIALNPLFQPGGSEGTNPLYKP